MSCLYRPTRCLIELNRGAVIVGVGALAAHLIEAKAFPGFIGIKARHEFARIEMRSPRALVVHKLSVGEKGATLSIEGGQLPKQQIIYNGPNKIDRVGGASRDVDCF